MQMPSSPMVPDPVRGTSQSPSMPSAVNEIASGKTLKKTSTQVDNEYFYYLLITNFNNYQTEPILIPLILENKKTCQFFAFVNLKN